MKLIPLREFPKYAVDLDGNIWRGLPCPRKLNPWISNRGYLMVSFGGRNNRIHKTVHRLVAQELLEQPSDATLLVCHRDGNKLNNHPSNLYWGTHKDNRADGKRLGEYPVGIAH